MKIEGGKKRQQIVSRDKFHGIRGAEISAGAKRIYTCREFP